jgi:hypothetical protein
MMSGPFEIIQRAVCQAWQIGKALEMRGGFFGLRGSSDARIDYGLHFAKQNFIKQRRAAL